MSGVLSGVTVTQVSAGYFDVCALGSTGVAYCWGGNITGGVGNASATSPQTTPIAVTTSGALLGVTLTQVSANNNQINNADTTCALSAAGAA
jgi:alpha-tubulin suppressor-like RCC1 family protein